MKWTQKESDLLKDLKGQEQLCADKYTRYAESARDPQLKNLFSDIARVEQGHLSTLREMEGGTIPQPSGGGKSQPSFTATYSGSSADQREDCYLCSDALSMEKHASHLYDTCVFEFGSEPVRNVLNHIQKEEQEHGKMIYDYMSVNSMYQ